MRPGPVLPNIASNPSLGRVAGFGVHSIVSGAEGVGILAKLAVPVANGTGENECCGVYNAPLM